MCHSHMSNTAACVRAAHRTYGKAHRTYGKWPSSRDGMLNTCGETTLSWMRICGGSSCCTRMSPAAECGPRFWLRLRREDMASQPPCASRRRRAAAAAARAAAGLAWKHPSWGCSRRERTATSSHYIIYSCTTTPSPSRYTLSSLPLWRLNAPCTLAVTKGSPWARFYDTTRAHGVHSSGRSRVCAVVIS